MARQYAAPIGILVGLVVWVVAARAMRGLASADGANGASHAEMSQRSLDAGALIATAPAPADEASKMARQETETELAELERVLGIGTAAGSGVVDGRLAAGWGYIDAWRRMNRIEESLLLIKAESLVVSDAFEDRARLSGSGMQGADELSAALRLGVRTLSPSADPYFATTLQASVLAEPADKTQARAILARSARSTSTATTAGTGSFERATRSPRAPSSPVSPRTRCSWWLCCATPVTMSWPGASVYYLVGGVVGLFSRLRVDAEANSAVEDYGLAKVRLIATPLISGLAAVSGVVLTALLAGSALGTLLGPPSASVSPRAASATSATASPGPAPGGPAASPLADIFIVARYPIGLLIAGCSG